MPPAAASTRSWRPSAVGASKSGYARVNAAVAATQPTTAPVVASPTTVRVAAAAGLPADVVIAPNATRTVTGVFNGGGRTFVQDGPGGPSMFQTGAPGNVFHNMKLRPAWTAGPDGKQQISYGIDFNHPGCVGRNITFLDGSGAGCKVNGDGCTLEDVTGSGTFAAYLIYNTGKHDTLARRCRFVGGMSVEACTRIASDGMDVLAARVRFVDRSFRNLGAANKPAGRGNADADYDGCTLIVGKGATAFASSPLAGADGGREVGLVKFVSASRGQWLTWSDPAAVRAAWRPPADAGVADPAAYWTAAMARRPKALAEWADARFGGRTAIEGEITAEADGRLTLRGDFDGRIGVAGQRTIFNKYGGGPYPEDGYLAGMDVVRKSFTLKVEAGAKVNLVAGELGLPMSAVTIEPGATVTFNGGAPVKTIAEILAAEPTLSDADALAAYLAQRAVGVRTPIQAVRSWLAANFLMTPLRRFAASDVDAAACGFVSEFLDDLLLAESLDGTDPRIMNATAWVVPAVVAAGVMSADHAADLLSFVARARRDARRRRNGPRAARDARPRRRRRRVAHRQAPRRRRAPRQRGAALMAIARRRCWRYSDPGGGAIVPTSSAEPIPAGNLSRSQGEEIVELFERTTNLTLEPITAGRLALNRSDSLGRRRDFEDLTPTRFASISGDPPAEYPRTAKGGQAKDCLGNEFLLWLWHAAGTHGGDVVTGPTQDDLADLPFTIMFSGALELGCCYGQSGRTTLRFEVPTEMAAAHPALRSGKLERRANVTVAVRGQLATLKLAAESLATGVKLPDVEEADSARVLFKERITLLRDWMADFDRRYATFLDVRAGDRWSSTRDAIAAWSDPQQGVRDAVRKLRDLGGRSGSVTTSSGGESVTLGAKQ